MALTIPMFVSALLFHTYDISMTSLTLEIYRHFNAPFLVGEFVVVAIAGLTGFRLRAALAELDSIERAAILLFLATFWVGGVYRSQMPAFAAFFNLTYLIHIVFLAAVWFLIRRTDGAVLLTLAKIIAASLAAFAVLVVIKFSLPPRGVPVDTIRWQFAIPGMISVRLFGALLAPLVVLFCCAAIASWSHPRHKAWMLLASALASGLLAWSGTRAGVLAVVVAMAIYVFGFRNKLTRAPVIVTGLCCVGGALIGMACVPYGDPDFLLFNWGDVKSVDAMSSGRLEWWIELTKAYFADPFFGAGPGASSYVAGERFPPHVQPHNFILEFFLNWGAVAACAALFLLFRLVRAAHRIACEQALAIPFVLMADSLLVVGLFDGTLHFAQHVMLFAAALGIACGIGRSPAASRT